MERLVIGFVGEFLSNDSHNSSSCSEKVDCTDCVGTFSSTSCVWCSGSNECIKEGEEKCSSGGSESTCDTSYYLTIFVIVIGALVCLCCASCLLRRLNHRNESLFAPLLHVDRGQLFRNSLFDRGEAEWMCVICGFDNKPRANHCSLCGTSRQFTLDYKLDKKRYKKGKRAAAKAEAARARQSITIPDDAQLTEAPGSRHSLSPLRSSLSASERQEAFNYRRLNQLTLRQKSARRRRMWQRSVDPNSGELIWERVNFNQAIHKTPSERTSMDSNMSVMSPIRQSEVKYRESFDDTQLSHSPGYTSMFNDTGDLMWEKVESGKAVARNPSRSYAYWNNLPNIPPQDLPAVAALSFSEKHVWFLDLLTALQRPWSEGHIRLEIERNRIFESSFEQFMPYHLGELHRWMRIQFVNEPGIDAGGLEREWFHCLITAMFDVKTGLFSSSGGNTGTYHINPISHLVCSRHLEKYQFCGRILAKAIMEQQSINAFLSVPLRKQILSLPITFSDLEFVDSDVYKNLLWVQQNEDVESLGLYFTVDYQFNKYKTTYELIPGGSEVPVTDENKQQYLELRLRHRMLDSIKPQLEYFLRGFYEVLPCDIVSVFDYQELELLMCGVPDLNLDDWKRHCEYLGEYSRLGERHRVIRWFWSVVESYSAEERVRLLQFTTGCSRLPAQGFKALQSNDGNYRKFNIQSVSKEVVIYSFVL